MTGHFLTGGYILYNYLKFNFCVDRLYSLFECNDP